MKTISLVIPCYNEELNIKYGFDRLQKVLDGLSLQYSFELVYVNDGSKDGTLSEIEKHMKKCPYPVRVIDLYRNFGSTRAIACGVKGARGDAVFVVDGDMQNPPELLPDFIKQWQQGCDIVYGKRKSREKLSFIRRLLTGVFYTVFNRMSEVDIPENTSEFVLLSRKVVDTFNTFAEQEVFTKGIYAWIGGKRGFVAYVPEERKFGTTSFSPFQLFKLAFEGLFTFSLVPLRVWTFFGGAVACFSFIYMIYRLVRTWLHGVDIPGYESTIVIVLFIGGVQLLGLGIVGEYIGRIYKQVKGRPRVIIRDIKDNKK